MFKILVQNCIAKNGENYKCHLCPFYISSCNYKAALEHINDSRHKELANIHAWDKIRENQVLKTVASFTDEQYQSLVEKGIIFKSTFYYCTVCTTKFSGLQQLQIHLKSDAHTHQFYNNLKRKNDNKRLKPYKTIQNEQSNQEVSSSVQTGRNGVNKPNYQQLKENRIEFFKDEKLYKCKICNYFINGINNAYKHIEDTRHKHNFDKQKKFERNTASKSVIENKYFYCSKCNVYFTVKETLIQCHCMMHLHQEQPDLNFDIIQFDFGKDGKVNIKCLLCDVEMDSDKTLAEHVETPKHMNKCNFLISINSIKTCLDSVETMDDVKRLNSYVFDPLEDIYITDFCTTCYENPNLGNSSPLQKIIPKQKLLDEQISEHKSYHTKLILDKYMVFYKCFLCNKSFISKTILFKHYNKESAHKRRLSNFHSILSNPETKYYKELTSVSDKLENLFLEKKKKRIKNADKKDVKFPYNKDILDFGEKYMSRCLEFGNENIYNSVLDSNQIEFFQFGISLTYLYNKSHRICIPCNHKILNNLQLLYEHLRHEVHIENLCDMKEDDKELEQYSDQVSYLDLAKSCMQEESEELVKCFACNITVPNSDNDIIIHMNLVDHIKKLEPWKEEIVSITETLSKIFKDPWYYTDKFYCKVCNLAFSREISFAKHLDGPEHLEKLKNDKVDNKINICHACSCCWYGISSYSKHCEDYIHKRTGKNRNRLFPTLKKSVIEFLKKVNNKVKKLVDESDKVMFMEQDKEKELLESVEETVKLVYPNAKAYVFGSRSSYLGFPTSDVDIFLDCENGYYNIGSKEESQKYIRTLKDHFFGTKKEIWKRDRVLLQPRVPIIKLQHKITGLKCDISFLNGLGVEKSKLIRNYVSAYQHCRELILYLKKWFDMCHLYGPQEINAYAISWYTIFYLQIKGILPSVYELIKRKNESKLVDGWQCGFSETVPVAATNDSFQHLLRGFFLYYAEFDFKTDVVCPLIGQVIKKRTFVNVDDLPEAMEIYKNRVKTEELEIFRYDSPMCIQDPVDLSQNITKAITKIQIRHFRFYCAESYEKISF